MPSILGSIECEFLSALPAPLLLQLLRRLTAYQHHYLAYHKLPLMPIWLNHHLSDDANQPVHSVIGLLPMASFVYQLASDISLNNRSQTTAKSCIIHSHVNLNRLAQWQSATTAVFTQASDYQRHLTDISTALDNTLYNTLNSGLNSTLQADKQTNDQLLRFELTDDEAGYRQFAEYLMSYWQMVSVPTNGEPVSQTDTACPSYQHGLMGFIGYDASAMYLTDDFVGQFGQISQAQPLAYFGHYPLFLSVTALTDDDDQPYYQWRLHAKNTWAAALIDDVLQLLKDIAVSSSEPASDTQSTISPPPLTLTPLWQKTDYQHAFDKVQAHLYAGDCYQINLTQCWQGKLASQKHANGVWHLVDYLPKLHANTHAPFAGYLMLNLDWQCFELLSCSPELFVHFDKDDGNVRITTKPIKGTRPRGKTPDEDHALAKELAHSEKDLAENVMIVDLLRNDLGKYAQTGSVTVPKRFTVESFSNVHHMVSTITATLRQDVHPIWVLFDSLPAGSITGTPKKRSVELIQQLEAAPRGAYCGTLGYLNFNGTGMFNVLIRTLQAKNDGTVQLWAGGGITVASECELEWQECHDKVGNLLDVLAK